MLRVKVVLDPSSGGPDELLGEMMIVNDGTGTAERGNYDVRFDRGGKCPERTEGRITGWNRQRNVWQLVSTALQTTVGWDR